MWIKYYINYYMILKYNIQYFSIILYIDIMFICEYYIILNLISNFIEYSYIYKTWIYLRYYYQIITEFSFKLENITLIKNINNVSIIISINILFEYHIIKYSNIS